MSVHFEKKNRLEGPTLLHSCISALKRLPNRGETEEENEGKIKF